MRIILSFILLLSAPFGRAAFCRQPPQTPNPPAPAAAQATGELKIDFNRRVLMRDRTELSADVYRPVAPGRYPVLLLRTPYTKTSSSNLKIIKYFVQRVRASGHSPSSRQTFSPITKMRTGGSFDSPPSTPLSQWSNQRSQYAFMSMTAVGPNSTSPSLVEELMACGQGPIRSL